MRNTLENLLSACIFERRMTDRHQLELVGAVFNGNATITTVAGQRFHRTLTLDGTGDFLNFGDCQEGSFGTQDFSFEVVFKTGSSSASDIFSKRSGINSAVGYICSLTVTNKLFIEIDDGTNENSVETSTSVNDDVFYHGVVTVDRSGNMTPYLNGVVDGSATAVTATGNLDNNIDCLVGRNGDGTRELDGEVALLRFWDKVLSADEVALLAQTEGLKTGRNLFDLKTNLIHVYPLGNIVGTTVTDIVGSLNGTATSLSQSDETEGYNSYRSGLQFDGANDWVTIADDTTLDITTSLTVSLWAKNDNSTIAAEEVLVSKWQPTGDKKEWKLAITTAEAFVVSVSTDGSADSLTETIDTAVAPQLWHHVAFTFDAGTVLIYINGKQVASTTAGTAATINNDDGSLKIGVQGDDTLAWDGTLQDVMIYDTVLTPLQIELLYRHLQNGQLI